MDRQQIGGWLGGPPTAPPEPGEYRGSRLGLPEEGVGSLAGMGRRFLGLCVDWAMSILIGRFVLSLTDEAIEPRIMNLAVFFVMVTLLTWVAGGSIGHRLFRLQVVRLKGGRPDAWRALVRTLLVCLVVPAVVWDRDGRGLHDKAAGTVILRTR